MNRVWPLLLALIVAGPGLAVAAVVAPIVNRIVSPVAPMTGAFTAALQFAAPSSVPLVPSVLTSQPLAFVRMVPAVVAADDLSIVPGPGSVDLAPRTEMDLSAAWRLSRVVKRLKPDVIHAHDPHGIAMASLALSLGSPSPAGFEKDRCRSDRSRATGRGQPEFLRSGSSPSGRMPDRRPRTQAERPGAGSDEGLRDGASCRRK